VCTAPTDTEAVFMPTDAAILFAMMQRWSDQLDAWPSVWLCSTCEADTASAWRALARCPVEIVLLIDSPMLAACCRAVVEDVRRRRAAQWAKGN
jgi:hypothetical protein